MDTAVYAGYGLLIYKVSGVRFQVSGTRREISNQLAVSIGNSKYGLVLLPVS
jgi:hypothetical protein